MPPTGTTRETPTRRDCIKGGGSIVGGSLIAGCSDDSSTSTSTAPSESESATSPTAADPSYHATLAPAGEVTFEEPPESIFTRMTHKAGMVFALGRSDDLNALFSPEYYSSLWNQFTARLPGVSIDWSGLYSSWNPSKEKLYELDSDVHLTDPANVAAQDGWSRADVEEVREQIAPWFGNYYSYANAEPSEPWADRYEYYGLWEMFERVSVALRERERYEALAGIHSDLVRRIQDGLPEEGERATAAMALLSDLDEIRIYKVDMPGFFAAHTRPCNAVDAFGEDTPSHAQVDMEAMLDVDPDVLFALGGMHPGTDMAGVRASLEEHAVGRELSAVRNGRVRAQGARWQGPVLNLFQLEMTAKQLYPDSYGEWPTYTEGPYPEIPDGEQLFDRQRVADVINGEF